MVQVVNAPNLKEGICYLVILNDVPIVLIWILGSVKIIENIAVLVAAVLPMGNSTNICRRYL